MNHRSVFVAVGSAIAVSGLAGSLLVGHSVRASLRDLAFQRLGSITHVVEAPGFVRETFPDDLRAQAGFGSAYGDASPLIALDGFAVHEPSRRRSLRVEVFGVGDGFWRQNGRSVAPPGQDEAYVSEALARDLQAEAGDLVRVHVAKPARIPVESLFGARDDLSATVRVTVRDTLSAADLGEFSLRPRADQVRAVFVHLTRLQRAIDRPRRINTILIGGRGSEAAAEQLRSMVRRAITLDDLGVTVRVVPDRHAVAIETRSGLVSEALATDAERAVAALGATATPVLSYLVNAIRVGDRSIPYSFVTATSLPALQSTIGNRQSATANPQSPIANRQSPIDLTDPPIVLTNWAARRLGARAGDTVWLSYSLWAETGRLTSEMARFQVASIVPLDPASADRELVPRAPGIFAEERMSEWAPPFPIDHAQITAADEEYWRQFRMTPKAFIPIDVGQRMWSSPLGRLTSMRVSDSGRPLDELAAQLSDRLRAGLSPETVAVTVRAARREALDAARQAADLAGPVLLASLILIVAGLLVAATGAAAVAPRDESAIAAAAGSLVGSIGAIGYAAFVLHGLRTWWVDAASASLELHVSAVPLCVGVVFGWLLAIGTLDLRLAGRADRRERPIGAIHSSERRSRSLVVPLMITLSAGPGGLVVIALSITELLPLGAGFVAAGALSLAAAVAYLAFALRCHDGRTMVASRWRSLPRAGFHAAARQPGRSISATAVVAAIVFLILTAGTFGPRERSAPITRRSGAGGFPLIAESAVPVVHDLDTSEGQRAIGLGLPLDLPLSGARYTRLRFRPGDDVSLGNLLRATRPAVLGAPVEFIQSNRFAFAGVEAETPDERQNPWILLEKDLPDQAVPVIADRHSLRGLGVGLGGAVSIVDDRGQPATLRVVAVLTSSVFQQTLVMADSRFTRLFPDVQGSRFFLIDVEPRWAPALATRLDTQLASLGFDSVLAAERLASFARAPRALIAAFQALATLGLVVGVLGVAAASRTNARPVPGEPSSPSSLEIAWVVGAGLAAGAAAALLAIAPSFFAPTFYN